MGFTSIVRCPRGLGITGYLLSIDFESHKRKNYFPEYIDATANTFLKNNIYGVSYHHVSIHHGDSLQFPCRHHV